MSFLCTPTNSAVTEFQDICLSVPFCYWILVHNLSCLLKWQEAYDENKGIPRGLKEDWFINLDIRTVKCGRVQRSQQKSVPDRLIIMWIIILYRRKLKNCNALRFYTLFNLLDILVTLCIHPNLVMWRVIAEKKTIKKRVNKKEQNWFLCISYKYMYERLKTD